MYERVPEAGSDPHRMAAALEQAQLAFLEDEVPVGAVILAPPEIGGDAILARAHNRTRASGDPTAHAELLALRAAAAALGYERLQGCTLYTTLEPCIMCAGALIHARVARLVFGTRDPKFGGVVSLLNVLDVPGSNHRVRWDEGCRAEEARMLLRDFFRAKRTGPDARSIDAAERWQSG